MPRILLVLPSSTYRGEAFVCAAQRLRLEVTLAVERGALLNEPPRHECLVLESGRLEQASESVRDYARQKRIAAVIGVDDRTAILAAHLAASLKLPHNSVDAVTAAGNKAVMRSRLRAHGVPVPDFLEVSLSDDPSHIAARLTSEALSHSDPSQHLALGAQHFPTYPVVLKPLTLSASCGVIRADTPTECEAAFRRIAALLASLGVSGSQEAGRRLLIETFVPGQEVALEGLMTGGAMEILALFDKPDPLDGPFFEETIYVTPSRLPSGVQRTIHDVTARAARALGLVEGPIHAELRVNEQGVWVIEVAARSIGGRCSRTLHFASGLTLEELILRHALRLPLPPHRLDGAAGVMMIPIPQAGVLEAVHGVDTARTVSGVEEVSITADVGERLVPLPEGTRYLGFIVARSKEPAAVESALRTAHAALQFSITPHRQAPVAALAGEQEGMRIRF